jgi:ADP-ribosylglycohydrolase
MIGIKDRISGGLWGLLIGDALGVPYEFNHPEDLPPIDKIEYNPPIKFISRTRGYCREHGRMTAHKHCVSWIH